MTGLRLVPAGDSALLLELPPSIDPATSARVLAIARTLEARHGSMLRDLVVGYCSLTVYFDPLAVDGPWLESAMLDAIAGLDATSGPDGALVDVPVCYGGDLGPDLPDVAKAAGCSEEEVVALHCGTIYRVYLVGFVPGFPYMARVDPRLALPRRASPRPKVPAGSVALAAGQTGIYPMETPGGWHLIGRTPVKPYDPARAEPFLLRAGDQVRFHSIAASEFERWPR